MSADVDLIRDSLRKANCEFDCEEALAALDRLAAERENLLTIIRDAKAKEVIDKVLSEEREEKPLGVVAAPAAQLHALMRACNITEVQVFEYLYGKESANLKGLTITGIGDDHIAELVRNWPDVVKASSPAPPDPIRRKSAAEVMDGLNAMCDNAEKARQMDNAELSEALRRTVGDNAPMDTLAYDLVEEAASRLEAI